MSLLFLRTVPTVGLNYGSSASRYSDGDKVLGSEITSLERPWTRENFRPVASLCLVSRNAMSSGSLDCRVGGREHGHLAHLGRMQWLWLCEIGVITKKWVFLFAPTVERFSRTKSLEEAVSIYYVAVTVDFSGRLTTVTGPY